MSKPKGGRGNKSNYTSTHVRIPDDLKGHIERLKELYFNDELEKYDKSITENCELANKYREILESNIPDTSISNKPLTSLEDAKSIAKGILKQKKCARETVAKLLTALFDCHVSASDLKD